MDAIIMGAFGLSPQTVSELEDDQWIDTFHKAAWFLKITNPFPAKK
jgi:hypothetical protein